MSYTALLRAHLEDLLTGATGTTRALPSGRFHLRRANPGAGTPPERAVAVRVLPAFPDAPVNSLDSLAIVTHPVDVEVRYALTAGGDDLAEGLTEQDGPGAREAAEDRAGVDAADIAAVLCWHENWPISGDDPAVIDVYPRDAAPTLTADGGTLVLALPYAVRVQARLSTQPYAP